MPKAKYYHLFAENKTRAFCGTAATRSTLVATGIESANCLRCLYVAVRDALTRADWARARARATEVEAERGIKHPEKPGDK